MTLEAGKEMDKRCVLNWLNEVYVTPSRAFDEYTEDELKMFAHDALVLLKGQEAKQVIGIADSIEGMEVGYCPSCDRAIVNKKIDETKFCKFCGQAVKWE